VVELDQYGGADSCRIPSRQILCGTYGVRPALGALVVALGFSDDLFGDGKADLGGG
jgi:hypothetical protein